MNIAFLNLYHSVNSRGAESFTSELGKRLGKTHSVVFFEPRPGFNIVQPTSSTNLLKRFFLDSASLSALKFTLSIFHELWQGKFDVFIPTNGFWQVLLCKVVGFFKGGKILITGHSGIGWDERWNLLLSPNVFVATSKEVELWAKNVAPWVKVVLIPLAVDLTIFHKAKPAKLNLERPIILCPAAADPYKRVDLAVKAVAKLKKGSLLHLGKGQNLLEIQKLGNDLLGPTRFASLSVPYSEVPDIFKAVDLVTLPSSGQESFGMVLLEALASGKLVVATDSPKNHWILGPGGVFVDPENIEAYAKTLEATLNHKPDVKALAKHLEQFSWPTVQNQYETLLSTL